MRHGQTAWNVGEVFRGRADIELNETGRRQAQLLGEFLSVPAIEAVYSSPLKRALDTARSVAARHNLEVRISGGLNDMNFGEWEGVQAEVVKQRYPEVYAAWSQSPERARIPGGERLAEVKERAVAAVNDAVLEALGHGGLCHAPGNCEDYDFGPARPRRVASSGT